MEIASSNRRTMLILALFGIWLLLPGQAMAYPDGISGRSGASGSTCTGCHSAGAATPTVTLSADLGTTTVSPGSSTSYTLTMAGGPAVNSGLDVAVSAGTIIDTNANGTRILSGELTMSSPNTVSGGTISWSFDWQAPTAPGTYTIYAAALSGNGNGGTSGDGTGTTSLQITVAAPTNQPPTAMISGPTNGIDGVAVTFDGSGSSDSDGTIVSYDWDLGDGSAATGVSATHAFAGGSYTVTLTVTDNSGNTDTETLTIEVAVPNVAPVAEISGPTNGTEGVAVSFDGSASTDPDGNVVAYDWDFGDNTAGSGETVTHTFAVDSFTVTLTVTDDMGATNSASLIIDIAASTEPQPPIADAGGPYTAEVGAAVQFDGSASTDSDGSIVSYSWDFGDGTSADNGVGPVHTYTASGIYTVVLTVTDDQGLSGSGQITAQITEVNVPQPPVADAGGPYTAEVGATVQFDGSASTDLDGSIASYGWDFGDGSAAGSGVSPVHTYTATGAYTVILTVTDDQGMTDSGQTTAQITEVNVPPPPTEPETGEELYNNYCVSCHGEPGTGGRYEDVAGESADDIAEAIQEERAMRFLADELSNSDIEAIAEYLNGSRRGDDEEHVDDQRRGDHDGRGDGHNRGGGHNRGDGKNDGGNNNGGNDKGSSSNRSNNPFATAEDGSQARSTGGDSGGGALDWLILLFSMVWVAIRTRRPW